MKAQSDWTEDEHAFMDQVCSGDPQFFLPISHPPQPIPMDKVTRCTLDIPIALPTIRKLPMAAPWMAPTTRDLVFPYCQVVVRSAAFVDKTRAQCRLMLDEAVKYILQQQCHTASHRDHLVQFEYHPLYTDKPLVRSPTSAFRLPDLGSDELTVTTLDPGHPESLAT